MKERGGDGVDDEVEVIVPGAENYVLNPIMNYILHSIMNPYPPFTSTFEVGSSMFAVSSFLISHSPAASTRTVSPLWCCFSRSGLLIRPMGLTAEAGTIRSSLGLIGVFP